MSSFNCHLDDFHRVLLLRIPIFYSNSKLLHTRFPCSRCKVVIISIPSIGYYITSGTFWLKSRNKGKGAGQQNEDAKHNSSDKAEKIITLKGERPPPPPHEVLHCILCMPLLLLRRLELYPLHKYFSPFCPSIHSHLREIWERYRLRAR